jgi:AcrR family transcriptional regulator
VSSAEGAQRLVTAAVTLGAARGVGALSIQAIAQEAGVSKALVLYHFTDKASLLVALFRQLAADSTERMRVAAADTEPLEAWRRLLHAEVASGDLALLAALSREAEVRDASLTAVHRAREGGATMLATAVVKQLELRPRVTPALLGCALLRHLDGMVLRAGSSESLDASERERAAVDAEFDSFALALLALAS